MLIMRTYRANTEKQNIKKDFTVNYNVNKYL